MGGGGQYQVEISLCVLCSKLYRYFVYIRIQIASDDCFLFLSLYLILVFLFSGLRVS
jgi:hypothetical protein